MTSLTPVQLPTTVPFPQATIDWWDSLAADPATRDWGHSHWVYMVDTALIHADVWAGNIDRMPELRARLAEVGLMAPAPQTRKAKGRTSGRGVPSPEVIAREGRALELRRAGVAYDDIALAVGYGNRGSAYRAVQRAIRRAHREPAEALRALESDRLDDVHRAVWPKAITGDLAAVDRVIKVQERRAKLLGLDAGDAAQIKLTERQGEMVALAIQRILSALALTAEQQELVPDVVPRELRAIAATEAGEDVVEPEAV